MQLPHATRQSCFLNRWKSLFVFAVPLALAPAAQAQSLYWNVSSGLWPTVSNWVDGDGNAVGALAANNGSGDYFLTNGTADTQAATTMTGVPTPRFINSLTIGEFNTLFLTGTADAQNAGTPRVVAPLTNAGLIQTGASGTDFQRIELNTAGSNINTGEIRVSQGTLRLQINNSGTVNNTDGLIRVLSGATLNMSSGASAGGIQGGILRSEAGGVLAVGTYDVQSKLRLDGVTVDNQGTFTTIQNFSTTTSSARTVNTFLNGTSTLTNATGGTVNVLNTGSGVNAGAVTQLAARFDVNNTATFDNRGLLNITNDTTRSGSNLVNNALVFSINSATATFKNTGTIQVINESNSAGATAEFTSVKSITNEGTVRVKGDAGGAHASFTVTGSGNSYTQSGTGLRTLLERGGVLSAETVNIVSGDLGGVGTVTGIDTVISEGGRVVVADTLAEGAGAGILTFASHLTFENNSEVVFALGADTAGSGRVQLGSGFDLTMDGVVTLTLLDLDGSAAAGTYRLFELDGGSVTGTFVLNALPPGWDGEITVGADFVDFTLTSTAVPEPSTYALILGGVALGAIAGRRRRRPAVGAV